MPLKGDMQAFAGFLVKLKKLTQASRDIATAFAPKVAGLVEESFSRQASPLGAPWPATKTGAAAFGGGEALGRVLSRVVGKATVRTTVLYPLHFHQDGTHKIGRKRGRAIASKISGAYVGSVLKQMGLKGSAPRQRKDESDAAYQRRVERFQQAKQVRSEAKGAAKKHAAAAVDEARAAGGWHDPPRPMIPDEGDTIPPTWEAQIREVAREVMKAGGATEVR
jgi:signal recognition particle subunit SEC65